VRSLTPPSKARRHSPKAKVRRQTSPGGAGDRWRIVEHADAGADRLLDESSAPTAQRTRTFGGGAVWWAFSVAEDAPVYTELRRVDLKTLRETRATMRVDADPARTRATAGFAHDRGTSWYVRAAATDAFEIHMATNLTYEPAPPPSASFER
jgi:hypothetical protein